MFELYLDTADLAAIRELNQVFYIAGVTTNPKIIAASGMSYEQAINAIKELLQPEQKLFVQVLASDVASIVEDAHSIVELRPSNTIPKIPVSTAGLEAIKQLSAEGMEVLATAIYNADSAFMAALNGAAYLAPYVNRMCQQGDGIAEVGTLMSMLKVQGLKAKVLAASFKSTGQVRQLIVQGVPAVTLPPDVCRALATERRTDDAVEEFGAAWEQAFGHRKLL